MIDYGNTEISPGVRPIKDGAPLKSHRFYKLIWIIPLIQLVILSLPKWMWASWLEGRLMKKIVDSLDHQKENPSEGKRSFFLVEYIIKHKNAANSYFWCYMSCHILQLASLWICIVGANWAFGGEYFWYGPSFLVDIGKDKVPLADTVFPLRAKCTISTYGASGSKQSADAVCELNLNDLNRILFFVQW